MKIALYYPWLYLKSGGERTIAEMVLRSRHDWTLITNRYDAEATFPELRGMRIVELSRVSVRRSMATVVRAGVRLLSQRLPLEGQDALLVVCEGLGDFVTFRNHDLPVACLCLTPLRAVFDPHYRAGYLAMKGGGVARRLALDTLSTAYRWLDRRAWRHYRRVFAISREVRGRILAGGLCGPDRIALAYPGIDVAALGPAASPGKTFLIPGRIMWTKNLELGIDAFLAFRARGPDRAAFRLVIAGFVDAKSRPYLARLRARAGDDGAVTFVESPGDEALWALYRSAYAVLYPPWNEDWGIVPLEAMARGVPVIAVDRGGPRETILPGETGLLVEPTPVAFADAMDRLADDPAFAARLGARGRTHAVQYDWSRFCAVVDDDLEAMVRGVPFAPARHPIPVSAAPEAGPLPLDPRPVP